MRAGHETRKPPPLNGSTPVFPRPAGPHQRGGPAPAAMGARSSTSGSIPAGPPPHFPREGLPVDRPSRPPGPVEKPSESPRQIREFRFLSASPGGTPRPPDPRRQSVRGKLQAHQALITALYRLDFPVIAAFSSLRRVIFGTEHIDEGAVFQRFDAVQVAPVRFE